MPRINLEDSLFKDRRFYNLMLKAGGYRNALGDLMAAWIVAQQYWIPDKKPIPKEVFIQQELSWDLLDVSLAEEREDGIYMRGSAEQFQWWFDGINQRVEAGKKSAKRQRDEKGRLLPSASHVKTTPTTAQRPLEKASNESNATQPSSSSSSSLKKEEGEAPTVGGKVNPKSPAMGQEVIRCWFEWCDTLEAFGVQAKRPMDIHSESLLARSVKTYGVETVMAALRGPRYEKPSERFNRKDHLSLSKILAPDQIEAHINRALANQSKTPGKKGQTYEELVRAEGAV